MRVLASLVATLCLLAPPVVQAPNTPGIVAEVRQALGGDAALGAITSFSLEGRAAWFSESGSTTYSIRIECQLPDKILVTRMQSHATERDGINGNELIQQSSATPSFPLQPGGTDETPRSRAAERARRLLRGKQWFAALTLLLFARSNASYPLELADAGTDTVQAAPARAVEGRGADGGRMRLFVEPVSQLPIAVRWMATREVPPLPGLPGVLTPSEIASALNTFPIEHELHALDYKTADGVRWPRLLAEYIGGREVEEVTLRKVTVNVKFPPDRFQPTK